MFRGQTGPPPGRPRRRHEGTVYLPEKDLRIRDKVGMEERNGRGRHGGGEIIIGGEGEYASDREKRERSG